MTEDEYLRNIKSRVAESGGFASSSDLEAVEEALRAFPASAPLWCLRGDLIQLDNECTLPYELEDSLRSYERAAELDPDNIEAQEEIGHYYFAIKDDEEQARPYFERAARMKKMQ